MTKYCISCNHYYPETVSVCPVCKSNLEYSLNEVSCSESTVIQPEQKPEKAESIESQFTQADGWMILFGLLMPPIEWICFATLLSRKRDHAALNLIAWIFVIRVIVAIVICILHTAHII